MAYPCRIPGQLPHLPSRASAGIGVTRKPGDASRLVRWPSYPRAFIVLLILGTSNRPIMPSTAERNIGGKPLRPPPLDRNDIADLLALACRAAARKCGRSPYGVTLPAACAGTGRPFPRRARSTASISLRPVLTRLLSSSKAKNLLMRRRGFT
jgi:hypothetical protein